MWLKGLRAPRLGRALPDTARCGTCRLDLLRRGRCATACACVVQMSGSAAAGALRSCSARAWTAFFQGGGLVAQPAA